MRVLIHARRGDGSLEAFGSGVQAAGYPVTWLRPNFWTRADFDPSATAVLVHGLHDKAGEIHAAYRAIGVPVWILDLPRLRTELLAIGLYLNDLQWLPRQAVRQPVTPGRIPDRMGEYVLVCGQKPGDKAHDMDAHAIAAWARAMIDRERTATGLPVVYRPHPYNRNAPETYGADALSHPERESFRSALSRAAKLVSVNSTSGWEAIDAGVPVECTSPACAYRAYQGPLSPTRRMEALGRAASSQWTMYELDKPETIAALFAQHAASTDEPMPTDDAGLEDLALAVMGARIRRRKKAPPVVVA